MNPDKRFFTILPRAISVTLVHQNVRKMFTVQQIKAVHATVRSGADFPRYVQEIKALGLVKYEFLVKDGRTIYYGQNDYQVEAPAMYLVKTINRKSQPAQL